MDNRRDGRIFFISFHFVVQSRRVSLKRVSSRQKKTCRGVEEYSLTSRNVFSSLAQKVMVADYWEADFISRLKRDLFQNIKSIIFDVTTRLWNFAGNDSMLSSRSSVSNVRNKTWETCRFHVPMQRMITFHCRTVNVFYIFERRNIINVINVRRNYVKAERIRIKLRLVPPVSLPPSTTKNPHRQVD